MIEILFILILILVCLYIGYCLFLVKKKIQYENFRLSNLKIYVVYSDMNGPLACFFNEKKAEDFKWEYETAFSPERISIDILYVEL